MDCLVLGTAGQKAGNGGHRKRGLTLRCQGLRGGGLTTKALNLEIAKTFQIPLYKQLNRANLRLRNKNFMRNTLPLLAAVLIAGALATGCANTERKFGRGMMNTFEIVRGGEFRRTTEQTALFDSPDSAYGVGFIRGLNRSLARTGVGIYEMVTAPFPPYDPVWTDYLAPGPVYPDN